jgi:hypothetical protein
MRRVTCLFELFNIHIELLFEGGLPLPCFGQLVPQASRLAGFVADMLVFGDMAAIVVSNIGRAGAQLCLKMEAVYAVLVAVNLELRSNSVGE